MDPVNSTVNIQKLAFEQILPVWSTHLWPDRESAIETHSAMTWPFEGDSADIDMTIFEREATFWGIWLDGQLVGVNSGHQTTDLHYRSRGLWVDPYYRGRGLAQLLFTMTEWQAREEGAEMIWSIPRKTALRSYTSYGFETVGDFFGTETAESNIYVSLWLS